MDSTMSLKASFYLSLSRKRGKKIGALGGNNMKRKLLALLLTLAMIMSLVPTVALAAEGSTSADPAESTDSNENTNAEKTITFSAGSALTYAENTVVVDANGDEPTLATPALKEGKDDVTDGFEWVCGKLTHNANGSWSWAKASFDSSSAGEYTYRMQLKDGYVYTDGAHSSNEEGYISSANYALPQIRVIVKPSARDAVTLNNVEVTSSSADGLKNAVQAALPSGKSFADITSLTVTTADGATLYWTDQRMGRYADPMSEEDAFSFLLDECYNLTSLDLSGAKLKASSQSSYAYQGGTTAKPNGSTATTYNVPTDGTWFPAEALYRERTRRTDGGVGTGMKIMACLESLTLPKDTTVIGMKSVRYTPNLTSITIPASVVEISNMAFQNTPDGTKTAPVTFAEKSSLETLGNYVFAQRGTGELSLPARLESIGGNCFFSSGITDVTIPGTVTEIGNSAFKSCGNLATVDLTAVSDSINIGSHAFDNMAKNSTIKVANVTMKNMLAQNYTYTAANTSVVNTAEFTDKDTGLVCDTSTGEAIVVGWAAPTGFSGTLTIPATVTNPNDSKAYEVTAIADGSNATKGVFANGTTIKSVSLGSNLKKIGNYAFYGCTGITEITIPASVTRIGDYAFSHQTQVKSGGLTKVTFEKSAASVTIGSRAFAQNKFLTLFDASQRPISMESMTLVNSSDDNLVVKINQASKIGPGVFMNNRNITAIFLDSDTLELDTWAFLSGDKGKSAFGSLKNGAVIYVDDETTKELLKDSSGDLTFTNSTTINGSERKVNNFIIAVTNGGTFADNTTFAANKLPTPVKAGYTFGGWYTDAACTTGALTEGTDGTYKATGSETGTVYYAKWMLADNNVEIIYNPNISGGNDKNVVRVAVKGADTTVASALFSRTGYTFTGWNTKTDGTGNAYKTGDTIKASNMTLYAQWTLDKPTISGTATAVYGKEVTLTANTAASGASYQWYKDDVAIDGAATSSLKLSKVADSGAYTVKITVGTDTATSMPTTVTIDKATPTVSISADQTSLTGSGTVKLTVTPNGVPTEGKIEVTCDNGITVNNKDGMFTATLPNETKTYTFTASYAGDNNHNNAKATCKVSVTHRSSGSSSGSSTTTSNSVSASTASNGKVSLDKSTAKKGDTVTVTVTPDAGYQLDKLTVTDKNGTVLKLTDKGDGKYSFTMPDGKVEVKAVFAKEVETSPFGDVSTDAYYYKAVQWAQEKGITDGIRSDLFGPKQPCTRSQIVTFLWRAAGSPEPKGTAAGMTDVVPGSYYAKAVAWAVENGITTGTAEGTFSPDATCTRAQAVTFLARAQNAKATGKTAFSDVPADSYFADAVAWAQANGVTTGTSETTFSPDSDCTRAQIVTFLYRANQGT